MISHLFPGFTSNRTLTSTVHWLRVTSQVLSVLTGDFTGVDLVSRLDSLVFDGQEGLRPTLIHYGLRKGD